MIILEDSIKVNSTPEQVFDWLAQRMTDKESYRQWHPEHVNLEWIEGEPFVEGSVLAIEEYLNDNLQRLKYRITRINRPNLIVYKPLFPLSLIATGNRFIIDQMGDKSCMFKAWGKIRFPKWLFLKMHKAHPGKLAASLKHMKEEGENLKRAVEKLD
ncbi:MAG: SRPBCC family protein [Candidatus Marinimicrobia bacterium]|nr:SRPBCC family protein [Candidatus Neomarinimicrobiota bacterium]